MWLLSCAGNDSLKRIFAPCQWANLFQNSQEKNLARTFQRTPQPSLLKSFVHLGGHGQKLETASHVGCSVGGSPILSILSLTGGIEHQINMSEASCKCFLQRPGRRQNCCWSDVPQVRARAHHEHRLQLPLLCTLLKEGGGMHYEQCASASIRKVHVQLLGMLGMLGFLSCSFWTRL